MMSKLSLVAPVVMAIAGSLLYHVAAKSIPPRYDPMAGLIGLYATALVGSVIVYVGRRGVSALATLSGLWHPTIAAVGIGALMIELGYLVAYRAGWRVSVVSVVTNGLVAVMLVPIGVIAFREPMTATRLAGIVLCLLGVAARFRNQRLVRISSHQRIVSATRSAASCCTKCPAPGTVMSVRSFSSQFHVPERPSEWSAVSPRPWNISTGILTFGRSGGGGASGPDSRG